MAKLRCAPTRKRGQPSLLMIAIGGYEWQCLHCRQIFDTGRGCLVCTEPVCSTCYAAKKHLCLQGGMTLGEIASVLGVSKERVRQIEEEALKKLARKFGFKVAVLS